MNQLIDDALSMRGGNGHNANLDGAGAHRALELREGHRVTGRLVQMVSRRLAHTRMRLTTGLGLVLRGEDPNLSGVPDSPSA